MNLHKIAIDVVLLPPLNITDTALKINRMLVDLTNDYSIVLDKKNCIPHISLAMGAVSVSDIDKLSEELQIAGEKYLPYEAKYKSYAAVKTSENAVVSGIDLIKDEIIINLQDEIKSILLRYNSKEITRDMIYPDDENITDFTLDYSSAYLKNSTGDNFSPHITVGYGNIYDLESIPAIPSAFECERIAICHLGNHCTCKKILWEYV
ncbi:MAG: hypothetical protein JXQ82_01205 [Methanomicrobiaceae archaeon]|nr:hypothetical protein [Methanomicrobiaceae archaeon]